VKQRINGRHGHRSHEAVGGPTLAALRCDFSVVAPGSASEALEF